VLSPSGLIFLRTASLDGCLLTAEAISVDDSAAQKGPVTADEVIELHRFEATDVPAHLAGEDDEQRRWFGFPAPSTEGSVRAAFRRWDLDWGRGGRTRAFAAREASSGDLVGGCEIQLKSDRVAQLSYWIFPSFRRRGYARRVITQATRFAFDRLDVVRMEIYVEVDNGASKRSCRECGFPSRGRPAIPEHRWGPAQRHGALRSNCRGRAGDGLAQRPIPTCWARCSSFPSVCNAGATITSAFWNSFMSP
jgi:RimJ/RimL family protein N-acetyltransferase